MAKKKGKIYRTITRDEMAEAIKMEDDFYKKFSGKDKEKTKRFVLEVTFPTEDPNPSEMEDFYESLSPSISKKWFYQEYGVAGKNKGSRQIGYMNLTPLQASTIATKAKEHLPEVKISKRIDKISFYRKHNA